MRISVAAAVVCLSAIGISTASDVEAAIKTTTHIPAQGLGPALQALAKERGFELLYLSDLVDSLNTRGATGDLTTAEALQELLSGTGLTYRYLDEKTVTVLPLSSGSSSEAELPGTDSSRTPSAQAFNNSDTPDSGTAKKAGFWDRFRLAQNDQSSSSRTSDSDEQDESPSQSSDTNSESRVIDEVVVTGTHIKGARPTSPVVTITQEEMRLSGQNNLGEVIRALPQNFSGGQNPGVATGASTGASVANQNLTGGSGLNLRGLGPDATLTLLNGARLPYDGLFQATDASVIPVAAIERVEILLDGASAIYGSDAVGGVANIVLKRDYEGVELSARFGAATDGGYEQRQYTAVGGTNWGSGGFLITGDYSNNDRVEARHRDYLSYMTNQNVTIYPESTQKGGLFSGHQDIGAFGRFNLDAFYTKRAQEILSQSSASSFDITDIDSSIWGVSPSLDVALPGDWSARLHGAFGRNEAERPSTRFSVATGLQTSKTLFESFNGMQAAGIELEGPILALPGGDLRASIGGGYRNNSFDQRRVNLVTTAISAVVTGEESSRYVYGEVDLPLVSEDQNIPLVTRLSLNAALRHETYDSFGASTTPKIGAVWGLAPGLDIKASWGKSFKVPTLLQRYSANTLQLLSGLDFGQPAGSQVIALLGADPDLTPEKAEIITIGFVAQPEFMPGFRLEFGYFDIDYTDRAAAPIDNFFAALSNPVYAQFVALNPTVIQQNAAFAVAGFPVGSFTFNDAGAPYDPALVNAIVDGRTTNVSSHRVSGVDLNARYTTELLGGDLSLSGNGSWITRGVRNLTSLAPEQQAAGVNYWPAKFRGRLGAGWSRDGFSLNANVNHIAGIVDRHVTPNVKRPSMTTLDLVADYQAELHLAGDVGFNLAVTNLLNEAPPFLASPFAFLAPFLVNYDSTNYSALGRVVSATITKRF